MLNQLRDRTCCSPWGDDNPQLILIFTCHASYMRLPEAKSEFNWFSCTCREAKRDKTLHIWGNANKKVSCSAIFATPFLTPATLFFHFMKSISLSSWLCIIHQNGRLLPSPSPLLHAPHASSLECYGSSEHEFWSHKATYLTGKGWLIPRKDDSSFKSHLIFSTVVYAVFSHDSQLHLLSRRGNWVLTVSIYLQTYNFEC